MKFPLLFVIHSDLITSIRFFFSLFSIQFDKLESRLPGWIKESIPFHLPFTFYRIYVCMIPNMRLRQTTMYHHHMNEWNRNENRQLNISFERILSLVSILFVHSIIFFPFIAVYIVNCEQYIILNAADESRTPMENVYISMGMDNHSKPIQMLIHFMFLVHLWIFFVHICKRRTESTPIPRTE